MKQLIIFVFAITIISSCHGQSGAVKDQQSAYKVLDDMRKKGLQPATDNGWTMTCLIDGKPWKATGLYPPAMMGRILGETGEGRISLYAPDNYYVGQKLDFAQYAVEYEPAGAKNVMWSTHTGEMEITKVAGGWVEGKFFFTSIVRGTDRKAVVTNGFFRVGVKGR